VEFNETGYFFEYLVVDEEVAGVEEADVFTATEFNRPIHCVIDAEISFRDDLVDAE